MKNLTHQNKQWLMLAILHILLVFFSLSGVLSKFAAQHSFLSVPFIVGYGGMIGILFIYAIVWQQIIKVLPLTVAYANRAATLFWGIVWGTLIYQEALSVAKVVGVSIALLGVILFVISDAKDAKEEK